MLGIILAIVIFIVFQVLAIAGSYFLATPGILRMLRPVLGRVPMMIAGRYLFTWKKRVAINIITIISVVGISCATAALIIILSVFNVFQDLIEGLYTSWDADVRVVAARGKAFEDLPELRSAILGQEGVEALAPSCENKAMLTYYDKHYMVTLKGVDSSMLAVRRLDTLVYQGEYDFGPSEGYSTVILGSSVGYFLNSRLNDRVHPIKVWAAPEIPGSALMTDPAQAVRTQSVFPSGYFEAQMEYDLRYVLVSLALMDSLYGFGNRITAYDLRLRNFDDATQVKEALQARLDALPLEQTHGQRYRVETWYEQHKTLFDVMKNEKLVAYLILTLMLLIAAVNIVGSLSMIVLEKTSDIAVLQSMGATKGMVRRTFAIEGMMVGLIGGISGMATAGVFTLAQKHIGIIKINGGDSFGKYEYFPIQPLATDYLLIFGTVLLISILASLYPSWKAAQGNLVSALRR